MSLLLLVLSIFLACSPGESGATPTSSTRSTYSDDQLRVSVQFPADWQPDPSNSRRFVGADGFLQLLGAAGNGAALDAVANSHATQQLRPFGGNPTISSFVVDGQPARLIWPSDDQPQAMNKLSEVLIQAPALIQVGSNSYDYVLLYADSGHIQQIAQTVQFS